MEKTIIRCSEAPAPVGPYLSASRAERGRPRRYLPELCGACSTGRQGRGSGPTS